MESSGAGEKYGVWNHHRTLDSYMFYAVPRRGDKVSPQDEPIEKKREKKGKTNEKKIARKGEKKGKKEEKKKSK